MRVIAPRGLWDFICGSCLYVYVTFPVNSSYICVNFLINCSYVRVNVPINCSYVCVNVTINCSYVCVNVPINCSYVCVSFFITSSYICVNSFIIPCILIKMITMKTMKLEYPWELNFSIEHSVIRYISCSLHYKRVEVLLWGPKFPYNVAEHVDLCPVRDVPTGKQSVTCEISETVNICSPALWRRTVNITTNPAMVYVYSACYKPKW